MTDCLAELLGKLSEQTLRSQIAACFGNLMTQNFGKSKMLKKRDNIGKRFVKRERVRVTCLYKSAVHSV